MQKRVSFDRSKTTSLCQILGAAGSLKFRQMPSQGNGSRYCIIHSRQPRDSKSRESPDEADIVWWLFIFKYCSFKKQTFHQVSLKTSQ